MIRLVAVVVPAADEEALIGPCLDAVAAARRHLQRRCGGRVATRTVVVADSCRDATAAVAGAFPEVDTLLCQARRVGTARAIGVRHIRSTTAVRLDQLWLANTDADSLVPVDWLERMVAEADAGAHLVLGTVLPADSLERSLRRRWLDRHEHGDGHRHVHGANFGIRADTYDALGGWPPVASGEDVALVQRALADRRVVIARSGAIPVATSARLRGRAPCGFAGYLRAMADEVAPAS